MKQLYILLVICLPFASYYSQEVIKADAPEVLKPSKFTDSDFTNTKAYEYKSKSVTKPQQAHSKVLVFVSNEEAFFQMNPGVGTEDRKTVLKPTIKDDIITLTNLKNSEKIVLKIDQSGDYIKLTNTKTKEVYLAKQKRIKNTIAIPVH